MPINTWIVEDNLRFREEIKREIATADDIVCTKTFATEAELAAFVKQISPLELPDVVLMDIKLDKEEDAGIRCTRDLKDQFPDLSIVMLTAFDDEDKIFEAFQAGANGYLLKDMAYERTLYAIREAAAGGMLMPEKVASKVLRFFVRNVSNEKYNLTPREREVLQEMCNGLTQKEIADKLFRSGNTIGQHVRSIYLKLQVNTRGGVVAKAFRERLVT